MKIVGCEEKIDIISLEVYDLDVKIDTGADGNSIHCDHLKIENNEVSFRLLDKAHKNFNNKHFTFPIHEIKNIKSSNGEVQLRPVIKLDVEFFGRKSKMEVSLTDRSNMKYPMLMGKSFLKHKYLVDVSKKLLSVRDK